MEANQVTTFATPTILVWCVLNDYNVINQLIYILVYSDGKSDEI